jgi:hypothetical protein
MLNAWNITLSITAWSVILGLEHTQHTEDTSQNVCAIEFSC